MKRWLYYALLAGVLILGAGGAYLLGHPVIAIALGIASGYEYGVSRGWSEVQSRIESPERYQGQPMREAEIEPKKAVVVLTGVALVLVILAGVAAI